MDMTLTWLRRKRTWAALAIASCLAALISHLPISLWLTSLDEWLMGRGIWTIPTFIAIYVVAAIFGIPNIVLILIAGTLFGLTGGVINASIADTLSIAACFLIGQTVGRKWIHRCVRENSRFHKLDRAFAERGWKIVMLTRLSPIFPSNILNYGFSITQINFWEYLFFSWLGMLPVIFTYVYVGQFGANMLTLNQEPENLFFQGVGLLATVGVMVYTTRLTTSALRQTEPST
ncbi:MAG: TVP38/TMEM64 family protein [Cyanobacteria bacterium J06554_3]